MASIPVLILLLVFLLSNDANAQGNNSHVITLGSSLSPSSGKRTSWLSPSGHFAFGFYPHGDGFAVGIWLINQNEKTVTWTAYRDDPPVSSNSTLDLIRDGLWLRNGEVNKSTYIDKAPPGETASAAMLDSGNFVLYNNNSYVIWESFDFPTDTILGGQNLSSGRNLVSSVSTSDQSSGRFSLFLQPGGNLVAYPADSSNAPTDAYWSSATYLGVASRLDAYWSSRDGFYRDIYNRSVYGGGVYDRRVYGRGVYDRGGYNIVQLTLSNSGVLFLHRGNLSECSLANSSYPNTENGTLIHRATFDADGIFRLYLHHFDRDNSSSILMEWSALRDRCEVRGVCGLNSYCSGVGNEAHCKCYPGFDLVNPSNKFLGCYRNFTDNGCRSRKDPAMLYDVVSLDNMWWGDHPYSVVPMKKEICHKSCLKDCNCGAVLYTGDSCTKYRLPLRYGRASKNISSTAFFKVIRKNSTIPRVPSRPEVVITESNRGLILILALSLGSISCLSLIFAIYSVFRYRHQVYRYTSLSQNANLGLSEEFALRPFSYNELEKATNGFKEKLGRGTFGSVYKGTMSGGNKTIAVKRLENFVEEGQREFQAEITAIARTHHRNLVRLLGFCIEGSRKLLVYQYMSNGSLAHLLFKAEMRPNWKERVRITKDVARGILYLHEECDVPIIHCNIKPQNILIDDMWTAKISDFGLAKLLLPNQQSRSTMEAEATTGYSYLAPEWQKNALISVKADTYSFGIMLLEIICCRSSIEVNVPIPDEIILSNWVYNCFMAGELEKLVEDENVDFMTLERMVKVGLWCIQEDPAARPLMRNVILMLEGTMDILVPPSPVI